MLTAVWRLAMEPEQQLLALLQRTDLQLRLADLYSEEMSAEAERLAPLLVGPRILDIGAGLGGYWPFVKNFRTDAFQLDILDYDRVDPDLQYGFQRSNARQAYSRANSVSRFLDKNGAGTLLHRVYDAEMGLPDDCQYETIVSLYSWGYHYPFEVYADLAAKHLVPGGRIVLDVRHKDMPNVAKDARFQILETRPHPAKQNQRLVLAPSPSNKPDPPV